MTRRRALMIASQSNNIPVWDGVTVTTPQLVDGYYEIYNGATLVGFNALAVTGKKGRVVADFALNQNWVNYNSWESTPPANSLPIPGTSQGSELDGQCHTIYGLYTSSGLINCIALHHLKIHGAHSKSTMLFKGVSGDTKAYACEFVGNFENISGIGVFGYTNYTANFAPYDLSFYGDLTSSSHTGSFYGTNYNSIKNCSMIGKIIVSGNGIYAGGAWGNNKTDVKYVTNCFESMEFQNSSGVSNAFGLGASPSTSYYDSTKIGTATPQGIAKTTEEIRSQEFVDLMNLNLPAGCLSWKLETKGLLAGWPVHDF